MTKILEDPGECPLILHSEVRGPIGQLSFLERALLLAELAMVAYNDLDEATRAAAAIGFPETTFFDNRGAQAYRFRNEHDCVIACRGTEPDDWNDLRADVNVARVLAETVGRVHRGFKGEVDDLWPMLEFALKSYCRPLWFCGHSLGGAMATLCAGRCFLSYIPAMPEELHTFGSPRVGDRRYVNFVRLAHYRWVNNNDIVTRLPPVWMGYRHAGHELYFDRRGQLRPLCGWQRTLDRSLAFAGGLAEGRIDPVTDHALHRYVECLLGAVQEERSLWQGNLGIEGLPAAA